MKRASWSLALDAAFVLALGLLAQRLALRTATNVHTFEAMLWTILIGFFVGVFARWLKPGEQALGWIMTTLVGVGGAVLATFIGQQLGWYAHGDKAGFLASVGGAVVVLVAFEALKRPRAVHPERGE